MGRGGRCVPCCLVFGLFFCVLSCYNKVVVSFFLPCLSSSRLPFFLALFLSAFRVLVLRLLLLRLLSLLCCLLSLLACVCLLAVRVALMLRAVLSLLVRLLFWCFPCRLVGLAWVGRLLLVVPPVVFSLLLVVGVGCWSVCRRLLFLLLVLLRLVLFVVVALVLGVRWLLLLVVVVGCCCGFPLVCVLPCGLAFRGRLLVRLALLVAGGSVFLSLLLRSCPCFSWVGGLFLALR